MPSPPSRLTSNEVPLPASPIAARSMLRAATRAPFSAFLPVGRGPRPWPAAAARTTLSTGARMDAGAGTTSSSTPASTPASPRADVTAERAGAAHAGATSTGREEASDDLELDAARLAAQLGPPAPHPPAPRTTTTAQAPPLVDPQLAHELLERAALWGDGVRGLARLRFGEKARAGLAGATVMLEHDGDALRVRVEDDPSLAARLRERLAARGIAVEAVDG